MPGQYGAVVHGVLGQGLGDVIHVPHAVGEDVVDVEAATVRVVRDGPVAGQFAA